MELADAYKSIIQALDMEDHITVEEVIFRKKFIQRNRRRPCFSIEWMEKFSTNAEGTYIFCRCNVDMPNIA
jgi:hypothetical protein